MNRGFFKVALILSVVFTFFVFNNSFAQEENLNVLDRWIEWSDGNNMLIHHLNDQAFDFLDKRDREIAGLKSKEDWIKRQKKVKNILMDITGPFPEKTPLNAIVTGVLKKDGYKIEKIVYESMPNFYVTGGLYIPDGRGKKPAILFVSGHTQNAFRYGSYQVMILNLVKKGFIVFAIDPVSQGERVQLYNPEKNQSYIGPTTREHSYLGNQTFISGVSLIRYFIWDGIRAVDYLLTRKEVDPERIGVTGQSGGGTQSSFIFAFDERIRTGAPINYITGFRRLLESIGPQDAEQNLYKAIMNGITHADLLEVRAPNPALISAGTRDFFSIQGTRETFAEIKKMYEAFEMTDNILLSEDDFGHGYTKKLREGIYKFFQKSLNQPGSPDDEEVKLTDEKELMITETGNVASAFDDFESVFDINKKETLALLNSLENSRKNIETHLDGIPSKAAELSGFVNPPDDIKAVFRGRYQRQGYCVEMYALHGEGDYIVPLLLFIPSSGGNFSSMIYLHPEGKITDAAPGGNIEQLVKKGYVVAAPDLVGTGEVQDNSYGSAYLALMIGRSIPGIQAGDVIRVANFLKGQSYIDKNKIGAVAFNNMGTSLLHAAAVSNSFDNISLIGSLISYQRVSMNKFYNGRLSKTFVTAALTAYDLPDLAASVAPKKLNLLNMTDEVGETIDISSGTEINFIKNVFSEKGAINQLNIKNASSDEEAFNLFMEMLGK
jgi:dienelactone hydrolase